MGSSSGLQRGNKTLHSFPENSVPELGAICTSLKSFYAKWRETVSLYIYDWRICTLPNQKLWFTALDDFCILYFILFYFIAISWKLFRLARNAQKYLSAPVCICKHARAHTERKTHPQMYKHTYCHFIISGRLESNSLYLQITEGGLL